MAIIRRQLARLILLGIIFIELNILDAQLTGVALALGSSELNPIIGAGYGSSIIFKSAISLTAVILLLLIRKGKLLKHLNICMCGVVGWNVFAVVSWL